MRSLLLITLTLALALAAAAAPAPLPDAGADAAPVAESSVDTVNTVEAEAAPETAEPPTTDDEATNKIWCGWGCRRSRSNAAEIEAARRGSVEERDAPRMLLGHMLRDFQ